MKRNTTLKMLLILIVPGIKAQSGKLDTYIQEALANNEVVKQKSIELEKSLYALKEAKTLFLPSSSFDVGYILSKGGRSIDLPLGTLLNPAYSSLNDLTQSNQFPQFSDQKVYFNPNNYYDARLHTTLDIYNNDSWNNKKIKQEEIKLQESNVAIYKRQLVKDVKIAWFQYQQSVQEKKIYQSALEIINESLRINQLLLKNGKTNEMQVLRSQTERKSMENALVASEGRSKNASAYFNFLLNKPLETPIDTVQILTTNIDDFNPTTVSLGKPEELAFAESVNKIAGLQYRMTKGSIYPKLSTSLDLGAQDFDLKVRNASLFYMFSVNLKWDLFNSGRHRYQTTQTALGMKQATSQYHYVQEGIHLKEEQSETQYEISLTNYKNTLQLLQLSEKYYTNQLEIYKEGRLLYIELLDAQNQLTETRVRSTIDYLELQKSIAELEHRKALYIFK